MLMNYVHSFLRWAILLAGLWAVIRSLKGVTGNTPYTAADKKAGLFFMIFCDLQLVAGLILFFLSPLSKAGISDMGGAMKDPVLRFFTVEHETMAIIAIALVHIGKSKIKKAVSDAQKHKLGLIFFGLAFIVILALIPWPFRAALGKGWF